MKFIECKLLFLNKSDNMYSLSFKFQSGKLFFFFLQCYVEQFKQRNWSFNVVIVNNFLEIWK